MIRRWLARRLAGWLSDLVAGLNAELAERDRRIKRLYRDIDTLQIAYTATRVGRDAALTDRDMGRARIGHLESELETARAEIARLTAEQWQRAGEPS